MSSLDPLLYKLSEETHSQIFEKEIKPRVFNGVSSAQNPTAIIFGGQPGAGKSALYTLALEQLSAQNTIFTGIRQK